MKVSVLIVTYNHEKFIEQAVRSALMQKTNFDFEVVVGEDCSTDGTADILRRLEAENPGRLRVLYAEQNLGMTMNYLRTFMACTGEYLAVLEGDDYWTAPDKLQKQADFLDARPECILCFHDVIVFVEGVPLDLHAYSRPPAEITGLEEILEDIYINTGSVMMRPRVAPLPPDWTRGFVMGDWPMFIHLAQYGKLGYIPETMSAYRKHPEGRWQRASVPEQIASIWGMYDRFNEHLGFRYDAKIQVLKRRWAAQVPMIAALVELLNRVQSTQADVEQLQKEKRDLKKQVKQLTEALEKRSETPLSS
jgi:glycosyltransferase involved in cell wall biosynthesis